MKRRNGGLVDIDTFIIIISQSLVRQPWAIPLASGFFFFFMSKVRKMYLNYMLVGLKEVVHLQCLRQLDAS